MNTKPFLLSSLALAISVLSLGLAGGCGADVATCDSVCALPNAPVGGACTTECSSEQQALAAAGDSGDFQAYLTCLANAGDFNASTGLCASQTAAIRMEASLVGPQGGIAPGSGTTGGPDGGVSTPVVSGGLCFLGSTCPAGSTCTNSGAGPCDSDQRLSCDPSTLTLMADGFPCTAPSNEGCGWGSAGNPGCSEMCSCVNGLEVCTGNCPDGGPASP